MRAFVVFTTAPDLKSARRIACAVVDQKLAACVSLRSGFESVYRWKKKIVRSSEVLLILKTSKERLRSLEKAVLAAHPYDTPEFLSLPVHSGSKRYLGWLADSLH